MLGSIAVKAPSGRTLALLEHAPATEPVDDATNVDDNEDAMQQHRPPGEICVASRVGRADILGVGRRSEL